MSDKPILFSSSMVRAILREIERPGTGKTQTRRVIEPTTDKEIRSGDILVSWPADAFVRKGERFRPRYRVGDRLYVREAWRVSAEFDHVSPRDLDPKTRVRFEADADMPSRLIDIDAMTGRFRQGMHMPRWASRITLTVTNVRVQRLQEISEADAVAEGVELVEPEAGPIAGYRFYSKLPQPNARWSSARDSYRDLWDILNAERGFGWDANPWVAAYSFRPILGNIDQIGGDA